MNKDILKKAVELADGFDANHECIDILTDDGTYRLWASADWDGTPRFVLDALAAQLVRQVNSLYDQNRVHCWADRWEARVEKHSVGSIAVVQGPDTTENTITAIVESGVLD